VDYNTRVGRRLVNAAFAKDLVRELAVAICVRRRTHILKGKNISRICNSLGEIAGCSSATARRYLNSMSKYGLVSIRKRNGCVYAVFHYLHAPAYKSIGRCMWSKPRHSDIILNPSNTSFESYKTVELSLRAQYIVNKQSARDYLTQTVYLAGVGHDNPILSKEASYARKKLNRYGIKDFNDCGMSNKYLRRKLHCGAEMLKRVVGYGESLGLFSRELPRVSFENVGIGMAGEYFDNIPWEDCTSKPTYHTYSYLAYCSGATRYILPESPLSIKGTILKK